MAQLNFNARTVEPSAGIEPVPAAWYIAAIDQSEIKPTSDGQGAYLELRYNILDGQYVGRKVFTRLNIRHNNQQTVEIAYKQLSAICHAVNVLDCVDSSLLHAIPHKIKVTLRQGGPKMDRQTGQPTGEFYEPSNEIKGWKNVNENTDSPVMPQQGNMGFPAQPAAAPQGWGAAPAQPATWAPPAAAPAQQPAQQPWQQPQQQPAQQPAAPAQQPWQQGAAAPTTAPGQQPWQGQPQQAAQPPAQQPQGAPAQPWGQPPAQQPQQPAAGPQGGQSAPWAQQPAQGGNMGAPAAGGAQPPWAR